MEQTMKRGTLEDIALAKAAVYCDDRLALIEDYQSLETTGVVKTDIFIMALCVEGQSSVSIDGVSHMVCANDLLVCRPNILIEKDGVEGKSQFRSIVLSKECIHHLVMMGNNNWDIFRFLHKSPVLHLDADEVSLFCHYYDLIRAKAVGPHYGHFREVTDALLFAFFCEFLDMVKRFVPLNPPSYSSGENLFKNFIDNLQSSYPKERAVKVYADHLHVTPKYLSAVCKEFCGKPASDLINQYVVRDIEYMLKRSDKSIKEVSCELKFPNLSFFGKYVKKHTGMSPKQYRKQLRMKKTEDIVIDK